MLQHTQLTDAMRAVDKLSADQQSAHDNEHLAMAIASVDHVRAQKHTDAWTAAHADAIRAIWGILTSLHDEGAQQQLPQSFAPGKVKAPSNPAIDAARRAVETDPSPFKSTFSPFASMSQTVTDSVGNNE
jgi:hypothetical protein